MPVFKNKEQEYISLLEKTLFFDHYEKVPFNVLVQVLSKKETIDFKINVLKNTLKHCYSIMRSSDSETLKELIDNYPNSDIQ